LPTSMTRSIKFRQIVKGELKTSKLKTCSRFDVQS
jgi:hypothetical protein